MIPLKSRLATKFILTAGVLTLLPMMIVATIGFSLGSQGIRWHTALHLESVVELKAERALAWVEHQRMGSSIPAPETSARCTPTSRG